MPLLAALLAILACSEAAYYPEITTPYAGGGRFESTCGGDTASGLDLSDVPAGPTTTGAEVFFVIDNQLGEAAAGWWVEADCSLSAYRDVPPGAFSYPGPARAVLLITDAQGTEVLDWLRVREDGTAQVVLQ